MSNVPDVASHYQRSLALVLAAVNAVRRIPSFAAAQPSSVGEAVALLFSRDSSGYTPLHHAAASDDQSLLGLVLEVLKHVKAPCPTVDARDKHGSTALHWAIERGHAGIIKALIDAGASPSAEDCLGRSSLHHAIVAASQAPPDRLAFYYDMIRYLLQSGADAFASDASGATCVHCVAMTGDCEILGILVELGGAPVNAVDNSGENALFHAVREGHLQVASKLLQYGIDAAAVNESQENVMEFCRSLGDENATKQLEMIFGMQQGPSGLKESVGLKSSVGSLFGSGQEFAAMWSSNPVHLLR